MSGELTIVDIVKSDLSFYRPLIGAFLFGAIMLSVIYFDKESIKYYQWNDRGNKYRTMYELLRHWNVEQFPIIVEVANV